MKAFNYIAVTLLAGLILSLGACSCDGPPPPPSPTTPPTTESPPSTSPLDYSITLEKDMVTLDGAGFSGTVALPQEGQVEATSSGKARMYFNIGGTEVDAIVNQQENRATSLLARPDPSNPEHIFYLYSGVAHFGKSGSGTVACGVGGYAIVETDDPLMRLVVDPNNPNEEIQIAILEGQANVLIREYTYKFSSNQELVFNSKTGSVIIRTPEFGAEDMQAFRTIADNLNIGIPSIEIPETVIYEWSIPMNSAPFTDERLRRAVSLILDESYISEKAFMGNSSKQFIAANEFAEGINDIEEAYKLLWEAGYPDGFKITIQTVGPVSDELGNIISLMIAAFGEVNIDAELALYNLPGAIPPDDFSIKVVRIK